MKIDPEIVGRSIAYPELVRLIESSRNSDTRKRDMVSAINRVLKMGGVWGSTFVFTADSLRCLIASIKPAAHGVSAKSFANIQSNLRAALREAGIVAAAGGHRTQRDPHWSPLLQAVSEDKTLLGLSRFINFCAEHSVIPGTVNDDTVLGFHSWLQTRTIEQRPDKVARTISRLWNRASEGVAGWPATRLKDLQIGIPSRKMPWADLPDVLRREAESYLAMRANPDIFDEFPGTPVRPLAQSTLRLQREHIRLAFDVVSQENTPETLADLVDPENFKAVLRHYLGETNTRPNAFATGIAKTLIAVAKHHVRAKPEELARLKKLAARLPAVPFDLTTKNKTFIQTVRDEKVLAALVGLPSQLFAEAKHRLANDLSAHTVSNIGLAIALLLIAPMRSQNLVALNWRRHVREFHGPRGALSLLIPANETKTQRSDLFYELDEITSAMLRWNHKVLLPSIGADPDGDVFVRPGATRLAQSSLSLGIATSIEKHVGIKMTAHQFRHLAAHRYLEARPDDFETVRQLLGHSFGKTTQIYAGLSGERASRAFGDIVIAKMEALDRRASRKVRRQRQNR